jgi:hypothetical protein
MYLLFSCLFKKTTNEPESVESNNAPAHSQTRVADKIKAQIEQNKKLKKEELDGKITFMNRHLCLILVLAMFVANTSLWFYLSS